jgi:hypothetical protein
MIPATIVPAQLAPLVVQGTGFHRRERVRVTITVGTGARVAKRARASRVGSFRLTFRHVPVSGGLEGRAAGRRGSRASFQFSTARG